MFSVWFSYFTLVYYLSVMFSLWIDHFSVISLVTLFELTVVNNWYITMVTSNDYICSLLAAAVLQTCTH